MNEPPGTGFETMQIVIIVIIMIFVAGLIFSRYAVKYINNNWNEYRCQPLYMMIAGLIGHDADENYKYCQEYNATIAGKPIIEKNEKKMGAISKVVELLQKTGTDIAYKIDSMDAVHNEATAGIMNVINNFKSTIMFMMEKLKVIIKKLLAVATVIIYTLFSSVVFMKSMMGGTFGGIDNILGGGECFAGDTKINGTPIQDLKIDNNVLSVMEFEYTLDYIYEYNGTKVTGTHLVLEDVWKMVKNSKEAKKVPYSESKVYCLITRDNKICINGTTFSDFISVNNETNSIVKNKVLKLLNPKECENTHLNSNSELNYYECGIYSEHSINTDRGTILIKNIKVDDILPYYGKVIGVIKQKNNKWVKINDTVIAAEQIILYNKSWIKAIDHPGAIEKIFDGVTISINTHMGIYSHDNLSILQYSEIESYDIENYVLNNLNRSILSH